MHIKYLLLNLSFLTNFKVLFLFKVLLNEDGVNVVKEVENIENEAILKENCDEKLPIKENVEFLTATSSTDCSQKKLSNSGNSATPSGITNSNERCVTITGYDFQVYKV